jgi:Flp pilus assembly protein TadD
MRPRRWIDGAVVGALLTGLASGQVQAPEPLDLETLPAAPRLDGPAIPRALEAGDLAAARRITAAWRFRNPTGAPPPVEPLTEVLYRLSLGFREVQAGPIHFRTAPRAAPISPKLLEEYVDGYTELARRLLGSAPPEVRVHVAESLPGALHGIHLGGHVVVDRGGLPDVLYHELAHFLISRHPGGRRLSRELKWLEEGLCERLSRSDSLLLHGLPPRCDRLPEDPHELFPVADLSRRPPQDPGAAYLPAAVASALVEGGASPFREGVPGLLRRLAAGEDAEDALRAASAMDRDGLARHWRRAMSSVCLPEALEHARGPVRGRLQAIDAAMRGDAAQAARHLAAAAGQDPGRARPWMVRDAIAIGRRLVRDPTGGAALAVLAEALPWAGLAIPGAFQSESWRAPLERLLGGGPPPRALLYLTLMLWETPHRDAVLQAWTEGFAKHAEETEWLQAAVLHAAFLGRLRPSPDAPYARVSQRLETIAAKLEGREDLARDLAEGVAEARAAYAFGAGDFGTAQDVLGRELAAAGWDARRALNLAACRYRKGDVTGAADVYRRALTLAPEHSGLRVGLAQVALRQERWDEAALLLEGLDPRGEDGYRILEGRARVAEAREQPEEAARWRAELEKVEDPPSDSPVPALFQVMIFTPLDDLVLELAAGGAN